MRYLGWHLRRCWSVVLFLGASIAHAAGYAPALTTAYPQLTISNSAPQIVWAACNSGGGGTWPSAYSLCDDGISQIMNIGFSFNFAGTNYSRWSMHTNGAIFFETNAVGTTGTGTATGAPTYQPANLPTTNFGNPAKAALFPFWADLQKNASANGVLANDHPSQPTNASFYQYQVLTQPSGAQVLVIQLRNVVFWNTSPQLYVNMQIQIWSTGQIVYSYGAMQAMTTNPSLRVGLQSAGGTYCHTLANNQTTSLSSQSFVYTWDTSAPACGALPTVNHYEIRHDGAATLCAEPVSVLACSSGTVPCPAANVMSSIISIGSVNVSGVTSVTRSPASFSLQSSAPTATVNLTWASGSAGTATLALTTSVAATGALRCTNVAGTSAYANCNITVSNSSCIPPPHHLEIQGPASGSNCGSHTFTVKAWADAAQTSAYTAGAVTGTFSQSGNSASIPNLGAFTIPSGSSTVNVAPITFPATGTTTFSATATPAATGATTCKFGTSTSCDFVVSGCGFNCVHTGTNASTGTLLTKLAGTAFSFDVVARKADGTVETTYAADADRTVGVELVDGSGATACASRVNLSPAVTSQNLVFAKTNQPTEQGRKAVTFTLPDAYANVRCRVTDSASSTIQGCSSDNFAVRPSAVTLTTTANATPPSSTAATTVRAGAAFTLGATTTTGTNYQGNLSLDAGKLSAQTTTQDATQASGGTVGTLTPASLPTNPSLASSNNATYNEVGYLYLAPGAYRDDSFTAVDSGTGDCVTSTTGNANLADTPDASGKYGCSIGNKSTVSLGRFIPHHFDTTVAHGCVAGTYTYSAQPFTVTATARNAAGGVTSNFQGVFAKATALSNAGDVANMAGNALAAAAYANGVGAANNVTYTFANRATNPLALTLRATDTDAVTSDGYTEGTTTVRSGRVRLFNAYGSERLDLPMTMRAEFWNNAWQTHAADSCTTTTLAFAQVGAVDIRANTCVRDTGNPGASGRGCAAAGVAARQFREGGVGGFAGDFNLWLQAPQDAGVFTPGSIDVIATVPAWLQFPWAGAAAGNPTARATFGVYKSPLIYRRENY